MTTTRSGELRRYAATLDAARRRTAGWVRAGIEAEGLERRIVWLVLGVVLVLGPAVFNLVRSESFTASLSFTPRSVGPYEAVDDPSYYRKFLFEFELTNQMGQNLSADPREFRHATIEPRGRAMVLSVGSRSPDRARQLVNGLGPQIANATERELAQITRYRLADIGARLLELPRPPASERLRLYRERKRLRAVTGTRLHRIVVVPNAGRPSLNVADRIADALPGDFPGRPSPFWAALAGLLLFASLWAAASYLLPPPGREATSARGAAASAALRRRFYAPRRDVPPEEAEPVEPLGLRRRALALWIAALAVVPILTLVLIARHGENVPFWDEWTNVFLFQRYELGALNFNDFWMQHNEHRPLFPRAADFVTGMLTEWDLRVEMYRNFAVAVGCFLVLLATLRRTLDRKAFLGAAVVTSVLVFSPVQWENWLWGWELEWFLSNLGVLGALYALSFTIDRSVRLGLAVAGAWGIVATFSLGSSLLLWPIGLALLLFRRRPWRVWAGLSVAVFAAYFNGWDNPTNTGSKTAFLEQPLDFLSYVTLYFGRVLALNDATGKLVGGFIMLAFLALVAYVVVHRRDRVLVDRAAVWMGLGLYSLGSGLITGVSRFNLVQATSRYSTVALLLAISTMALVLVITRGERIGDRALTPRLRRRIQLAAAGALLLAAVYNIPAGADGMRTHGEKLDAVAQCTRTITTRNDPCFNNPKFSPYPETYDLIIYLRRKGWAGY